MTKTGSADLNVFASTATDLVLDPRLGELAARCNAEPDAIVEAFHAWVAARDLALYEHQQDALVATTLDHHVIVNTPTGSGKSLIATAALFGTLVRGGRGYYTAPIKALVSERFFELTEVFGADQVGMLTGDASVNADAPIICCTAEILANIALREGSHAQVDLAVMDEFHWFADPQRGWAWQVPLLELSDTQFVLLSATLGNVGAFEADLARRTGRDVTTIRSVERPVPLVHEYRVATVSEVVTELLDTASTPAYLVHFTQAAAVERAQALASLRMVTRSEKDAIAQEIGDFRFAAGFGKTLSRYVRNGVGVHHAGMLPRYRRLVERLAQRGLLKVICGTDTLGVGINVPIRTVVFTSLSKFDGEKVRHVSAREFHQIGGRAGRAGFDTVGTVMVLAPEHVVDHARAVEKAAAKAAARGRKPRPIRARKPPPRMVSWGRPTFERLVNAEPEPLEANLRVTHSMVLAMAQRPGDGLGALRSLLQSPYERASAIEANLARADVVIDSLFDADVLVALDEPDDDGRTVRLAHEMPDSFALDQPLALFAVAALDLLDPDDDDYVLNVVSVIEAVLEDPRQVLFAQRDRARGEAMARMKAEGLSYDERMAELDTITYPQPLVELLEPMFAVYCRSEPWAADFDLSPKSVVREMIERAMDFADYVRFQRIARSEGVLLRYLSDAFKALARTVPPDRRTDELDDTITWLGELVRQVDSSLIDEWEQLSHPDTRVSADKRDMTPPPLTANRRAFAILVRNAMFQRIEWLARREYGALGELDESCGWTTDRWKQAGEQYFAHYNHVGIGADARNPAMCLIEDDGRTWQIRQIIDDPDGVLNWAIVAQVDLDASDSEGRAVVRIDDVVSV